MLNINGIPNIPKPQNASMPGFTPGSAERRLLEEAIEELRAQDSAKVRLDLIWDGREIDTSYATEGCLVPHDHKRILGRYVKIANETDIQFAIMRLLDARAGWAEIPWYMRLNIFRKAAYLLQTKYFYKLVAATMEDLSKTPYEAMIDICELVDFWNFNAYYAQEIYREQPDTLSHNFNIIDWRPLEGFVAALPPNNFTAIAGNLPTAPLMMGNVVICKPSRDTIFTFHAILEILYEAGLPPEVLAVVHGDSQMIGQAILDHPELAGVHFTGSTEIFDWIVSKIGENTGKGVYRGYPHRSCVGETGGKDFLIVYDDEDPKVVAASIVVGGFGYQGRKCSATSRVYMGEEMWRGVKAELLGLMRQIKVGDVADFRNYMGAVINEAEYKKIVSYIEEARSDPDVQVTGGTHIDNIGWFIWPTIIKTTNPFYKTMKKEVFGPVVTVCVLPPGGYFEKNDTLMLCNATSRYGLTGAINTKNIFTLCEALEQLRYSAGNIYDWKTTGAVVGQQPFGGARKSGTDDKAGSKLNLYKWVSPRTISLMHNKPQNPWPTYLELEK